MLDVRGRDIGTPKVRKIYLPATPGIRGENARRF